MAVSKKTSSNVSWNTYVPYVFKALSILLAAICAFTFLASLAMPFGIRTFMYISFMVLYVILIYGFWNMRKWIITLLGINFVFLFFDSLFRIVQGTQKISSAFFLLVVLALIIALSYISRNYFNGEYKNMRVIRVFVIFLVLSKILAIF